MTRYAVLGDPVAHSKSPLIHSMFARQTGEAVEYASIRVEASEFAAFVDEFFAAGGGGLNITLPHKQAAFALCDSLSQRAEVARAVNTLLTTDAGTLHGDNTDGIGLVRDIRHNNSVPIQDQKILLLGAGGAARGALVSLIEAQPEAITVLNRTLARAQQLQKDVAELFDIEAASYENFQGRGFDLIINATSMSISGDIPPLSGHIFASDCCCYDMMYAEEDTVFVKWARQQGAALALDGLGMLVEQAAESFYLWRGVRPETEAVILELRHGSWL